MQSQGEAERGAKEFQATSPQWASRFRILQARAALWQGLYGDVLRILDSRTGSPTEDQFAIPTLAILGEAHAYRHEFSRADDNLTQATKLCSTTPIVSCGDVLQARAFLESERGNSTSAEQLYERSLSFARSHGDRFVESNALLNLSAESLAQWRFDEAIDRSEAAIEAAHAIGAKVVESVAKGNLGWAHYKLGDLENALSLFLEAKELATQVHSLSNVENELTNLGYVYMDKRQFDLAEESFSRALTLARNINAKEDTYNALRVLARFSLQTGDYQKANEYAQQALLLAQESANHNDELYPTLVQGQVAAAQGDSQRAEKIFREVENDKRCPDFLKWEAEHSLAGLYEKLARHDAADLEYRTSLATFESARAEVSHQDSHISFLANAAGIYEDYLHFLIAQGRSDEGLRWADYSRARSLAEGLQLLRTGAIGGPPPLNARAIAQRSKSTILFYSLGEKRSYLWAINPHEIRLFPLPPGPEIDVAVQRYRRDLTGPGAAQVLTNGDSHKLYETLIAPVDASIPKNAKVFVIPDGSLANLNFETLVVPGPQPHFWIEDATVISASSLRLLENSRSLIGHGRNLLLIGNSVAPNDKYPELSKAGDQVNSVANHFSASLRQVITREEATPSSYLNSKPERFSFIHFVAHGTASRSSPLDSAIILSRDGSNVDSFKLYARDIIQHPLRADLVTISACYGAGERAYTGEGLVGLSWAFLRAGAHNVIAALWEATDVSTEQLMARFYDELNKGESPAVALRNAKLGLLRETAYRNPFYWAPFQLYAGS